MTPVVSLRRPLLRVGAVRPALLSALMLLALSQAAPARAADPSTVDLGTTTPTVKSVQQGLFPDDECEQLKASGFKCMGFKPPVRFSLPSASFKVGSAELPDALKQQLDVFAQALKGKTGAGRAVRVEGHADASGTDDANEALSTRRAEAARDYLVAKGVAPELLKPVGLGSKNLLEADKPTSPRNRRVVIGRDQNPPGAAN
jgi:OmpA-OmpF porin, OOP family